jgi:hypothetical protein
MSGLFITFGISAVLSLLWAQQGLSAPRTLEPVAAGTDRESEALVWQPPAEIAPILRARGEATGSIGGENRVEPRAPVDAAALEELRAEVTALRRAVDAIPAVVQENRPPDYAATLGGLVKAVQGMEKRLAVMQSRRAARPSVVPVAATHP